MLARLQTPSRRRAGPSRRCAAHAITSYIPVLIALAPLARETAADAAPEQIAIFFVDLSEQKRTEEVMRRPKSSRPPAARRLYRS